VCLTSSPYKKPFASEKKKIERKQIFHKGERSDPKTLKAHSLWTKSENEGEKRKIFPSVSCARDVFRLFYHIPDGIFCENKEWTRYTEVTIPSYVKSPWSVLGILKGREPFPFASALH
jgi:hypothetical protein